jgi:hypothetical protein
VQGEFDFIENVLVLRSSDGGIERCARRIGR